MRSKPSSPLCVSCLMTDLYCQACRELDSIPCCAMCEHPAIRLDPNDAAPLGRP